MHFIKKTNVVKLWPDLSVAKSSRESNIAYHRPRGKPTGASVIVCPGGGYGMLADHEGDPVARWLTGHGIAAFVLRYRLAPHRHPKMIDDASRAIRSVRFHANRLRLDTGRIGILGFSAGGHLAGAASTIFDCGDPESLDPVGQVSSRPDASILIYPVTLMAGPFAHAGCASNLLGDPPDPDLADYLSLPARVSPSTPPTFMVHSTDDDAVHVENVLQMASALKANAVPFALHIFERGGHGYGLAEKDPDLKVWPVLCIGWLKQQGFAI